MKRTIQFLSLLSTATLTIALFAACREGAIGQKPGAGDAEKFIEKAEKQFLNAGIKDSRASWVQSNFITDDTESIAADAKDGLIAAIKELADESRKFDGMELSPDVARKIKLLRLAVPLPAPSNPAEREELTKIAVGMESAYGKFEYCPEPGAVSAQAKPGQKSGEAKKCLSLGDLETIIAENRNPEELKKAWTGWHKVSPQYRKDYARFVDLANKGAREMGFKDVGAMWRSNYDMEPDQFAAEMERLWLQVKPLYDSLHTYVRAKLRQKYGDAVPATGPIPAQLLGNMWSQSWGNIYDIVKPADQNSRREENRRQTNGALWRRLLHLARLRFTAPDLLGAIVVHQAAGSRRRLPCQRLGHRQPEGCAAEDVHQN
jgi:peptidyl-dipeptidase A